MYSFVCQRLITAEELLKMPNRGRCELIAGELKMVTPAGHTHGRIVINATRLVSMHVWREKLGVVYAAETGFVIARDPDTVRAPDVAFVTSPRVPEDSGGFLPGPPDLAVEVVSPDERVQEVEDKVKAWIEAGAAAVWVVWPNTRTISVHRPHEKAATLREDDTLDGADVLPGFQCHVNEVFA